jgi:phospholipid transport system substrate-binding protein
MPDRRTVLTFATALLLTGGRGLVRSASAEPADRASAFIKATGDKLVAVVNGPGSAQDKRRSMTDIIDTTVDVDAVAKFSLGRFWRQASTEQQKLYLNLFHQVLVTSITAKIGDYQGVRISVGKSQMRDEDAWVSSVVERPNNPPTNVDWVISNPTATPKIIDVVAEGTSMRLTQRSDYASYLAHNNNDIDSLISAMRQQVAQAT